MNCLENKKLIIGRPYIEVVDEKYSRLCAEIVYDGIKKVMYFEVENTYQEYLCTELCDSFVIGIFYFASYNQFDIECMAPVSSKLLYQMNQYFIPIVQKMDQKHYKQIKINAEESTIVFDSSYAVGTAVSSGVDSFYSILSHHKRKQNEGYALTHVLVANLFNKYDNEDVIRKKFNKLIKQEKCVSEDLCVPMITMYTNHHEFFFPDYVELYSLRLCSYALALQKLFKVYLVSAGTMTQDTNFWSDDSSDYDILNTSMASTQNLTFYMSGGEVGRVQKIAYIRNYEVVKNNLHVCTFNDNKNCSVCDKCMRTLVSLDITGNIEDYSKIFDLELYKKKKTKYWGKVMAKAKDNVYGVLNIELLEEAKKRNYRIPYSSKIYEWFIWKPYFITKETLKKFKLLKRIYFKLRIDYFVYGKDKAELYRYSKGM